MRTRISVIVCAHNEAGTLRGCLHSILAQTRPPDELLVIDNASTDQTSAVAQQVPDVRVVNEPRKGLVVARETGRRENASTAVPFTNQSSSRASANRLAGRRP